MPEKMAEKGEEEYWDPMAEAYHDPKFNAYIDGPGSEMEESLQPVNLRKQGNIRQHRVKIYVKNIPDGINENGLKNLFLSAGKPVSIFLHPQNAFAIIEFGTPWEAELAIRDVNEAPPYYIKVAFSREKGNNANSNKEQSIDTVKHEENDSWDLPPVYIPKLERNNRERTEHGSKMMKELFREKSEIPACLDYKGDPRFYQFNGDDFNPSVNFYQMYGDCLHRIPSITKGRSYYILGNEDRYVEDEEISTAGTGDKKNQSKIHKCTQCCSETLKICQGCKKPFCSAECLNSASHYNSCKESNGEIQQEKSKAEYVLPKTLEFNKTEINFESHGSVFENFKEDTKGVIKLSYGHHDIHFGSVMLKDDSSEFLKIVQLKICNEALKSAKIGQLVLVPDEEDMGRRGIILSKGEHYYRVALIDTAEVVSVKDVFEAPHDVHEIVHFGAKLTIIEEINPASSKNLRERGGRFSFQVVGPCKNDQWPCKLISTMGNKPVAKVLLSKWIPRRDLECVEIKNGSRVVMTMYCSTNIVYIRPDDEDMREKFVLLSNEVAACATKSKPIEEPPVVGDMYCARLLENKCFYRAVVKSFNGDKVKIAFVDYGNEQEVDVKDLRPLPEVLKRVPCFAVKVMLKYVPKLATGKAIKYLNDLICQNEELVVKFNDSISNQVELQSKGGGEDVNRSLAKDITPDWMDDKNYKSLLLNPILKKKLQRLELKMGEQDMMLLHFDPEDFSSSGLIWLAPFLPEHIGIVNGELKDKLEEYCESFGADFKYLPRKDEICCAFYEGEWLRGLCLDIEGIYSRILFIDYGYKADIGTFGIRRMRDRFLEIPALAVPCIVNCHEKWKDNPDLGNKIQLYLKDLIETKLKNVNVLKVEGGIYTISINYIERLINASEVESSELFKFIKSQEL